MSEKCLIIHSSLSGNTTKVAHRIRESFEHHGWSCQSYNMEALDPVSPPFDFDDFDFICAGSPVIWGLPTEKLVNVMRHRSRRNPYRRIDPGPRKGLVFCTYAGAHLGPKEAEAALKLLEIEIEHLGFRCVGTFSCPGKYVNRDTPDWFHGDIRHRPDEVDLDNAACLVAACLRPLATPDPPGAGVDFAR